ncbi:MAG: alpha-mannosidase [Clostridiales bacterium]|nr:alpha-mannosidase [Clostridiales bacterium]
MKTEKPQVLKYMMKGLKKYADKAVFEIPVWRTHTGTYLGDGRYEWDKGSRSMISLGDRWEASYDCARIFRAQISVPPSVAGPDSYLELDFGGEALVRINKKIVGAVSSGWVNRDSIYLGRLEGGEKLDLVLEYAVDAGTFCDDAMAGAQSVMYELKKARIVAADEECRAYERDIEIAWEALEHIEDEFIRTRVLAVIEESLHEVDFDFDDARVRQSISRAARVLKEGLAKIQDSPQSRVFMTGHSHIDIAWLWRVQETQRKAARTFSNNLALMDRYPDFIFAQSQAILYDMTKKLYPELYERIKEKVKGGQWDIVGNVWVEADTNIASGEALIRQLLYGREFFKKEFGVVSDTYWLPDCFGFSWALPQIIRRSGMKYFITAKLNSQDTNRFPHTTFRWRGNDSSEVLAHMLRMGYGGEYSPSDLKQVSRANERKDIQADAMGMFGYGDGGGGCTHAMVERARSLKSFPGLPESKMAKPLEFFEKVQEHYDELPLYNDELYYENHRGTYTSQAYIKQNNRQGEFLLTRAEMLSVFAERIFEHRYAGQALEEAWKLLLKNQFHDILPGTSIRQVHEDCRPDYNRMHALGETVSEKALEVLNAQIQARDGGVLVWNLLSHPVTGPVSLKAFEDFTGKAFYDGEEALPTVFTQGEGEPEVSFLAANVPAMGYKVFKYDYSEKPKKALVGQKDLLENEFLRVKLDENGIITSVFDKENAREILAGPGNLLTIFRDKCVHETAWNLELNYQIKFWELRQADSIELVEANELRALIRIKRSFNKSEISQDLILYAGEKRLDFVTTVDWYESDKLLKAAFEVDILNTKASFETAHGAIERPTHWNNSFDKARFEQCAHKWADLSEGDYGVSILNDSKYGYDIKDNIMRISLLRSPTCPDTVSDHGRHKFTYSLYPHKGTWQEGGTVQKAFELNQPLKAFKLTAHEGVLPEQNSFVALDAENVIIDTIKAVQDGEGFIVRVYEAARTRGAVRLKCSLPFEKVYECNLMEENEKVLKCSDGEFEFYIKPFEVKTFRLI